MFVMQAYRLAIENISEYAGAGIWKERWKQYFSDMLISFQQQAAERNIDLLTMMDSEAFLGLISITLMEAFLSQQFPEPPYNLAEDYLKRRGWHVSKLGRDIVGALRGTAHSIYEIREQKENNIAVVQDFLFALPPVTVHTGNIIHPLSPDDLFVGKVFSIESESYLSTCVLPMDIPAAMRLKEEIGNTSGTLTENHAEIHDILREKTPQVLGAAFCQLIASIQKPS